MSTASRTRNHFATLLRFAAASLLIAGSASSQAQTLDVTLCAEPFTMDLPGAAGTPMWGYRQVASGTDAATACTSNVGVGTTSPGPQLVVPPGTTTLNVTLYNGLKVPTSLVIAGQTLPTVGGAPSAPVHAVDVVGDTCAPAADPINCRVRSFVGEAAPGAATTYTFSNLRPGTYLYQSGTHPQVQIQMGLFGLLSRDAPGTGRLLFADPSAGYDIDVPVVLSEVDDAQHTRIAATLGTDPTLWKAGKNTTLMYAPKFFLINGKVFDASNPSANELPIVAPGGSRVVLRIANAGLQSRVLMLNNGTWKLLTEDGNPYPAAREQASVLLPANKTSDAFLVSSAPNDGTTNRSLTIFDRRGGTDNADGGAFGGQIARLAMSGPTGPFIGPIPAQVANEGASFSLQVQGANLSSYTLSNAPAGMTIAATGLISWPTVPFLTPVPTLYTVTVNGSGAQGSTSRNFDVRVNHTPSIAATGPIAVSHNTVTVPAPGVLAGAIDPDGDTPLAAVTSVAPSSGTLTLNPDGSYTWTGSVPNTTASVVTFGVAARDPFGLVSAPTTVTLNVAANVPPTAGNDAYTITLVRLFGIPISVQNALQVAAMTKPIAPTLTGNDADADGSIVTGSVAVVAGSVRQIDPNTGATIALPGNRREATVTINADGTFLFTPRIPTTNIGALQLPVPGTYEFRYTVRDDQGAASNQATVRVTVQ